MNQRQAGLNRDKLEPESGGRDARVTLTLCATRRENKSQEKIPEEDRKKLDEIFKKR